MLLNLGRRDFTAVDGGGGDARRISLRSKPWRVQVSLMLLMIHDAKCEVQGV